MDMLTNHFGQHSVQLCLSRPPSLTEEKIKWVKRKINVFYDQTKMRICLRKRCLHKVETPESKKKPSYKKARVAAVALVPKKAIVPF